MSHFRLVKLILLLVFMFAATPQVFAYTQISAGSEFTCALQNGGGIVCAGANTKGQATPPTGVFKQISTGGYHACALKTDNSAVCWGDNTSGQSNVPTGNFLQISAGYNHSCAVMKDASVMCWGLNTSGQTTVPAGMFFQIDAGVERTCALKTDLSIACWGNSNYSDARPYIPPTGTFRQVNTGGRQSCAIKNDNSPICWGDSSMSLPPSGTYSQISVGGDYACALKTDGSAVCWSYNSSMPTFVYTNYGQYTPPAVTFTQISAGGAHTCALTADGTVVCWGDNSQKQQNLPVDTTAKSLVIGGKIELQPRLSYPLTVNVNGLGKVTGAGTYFQGDSITLTATADAGWFFTGWTPATCQNSFTMPSGALTCIANFLPPRSTTTTPSGLVLTVNTNGNGKVTGGGSYAPNLIVNLTATPDAGWSFTGWTPSTCQNRFNMPTSNLTCTANFSQNPVVVTPSKALLLVTTNNNNGTVTGGGSYAAGTPVTLTATPNAGWNFAGWTPSTCQNNFTMPSTAVTCMANFSQNPVVVTPSKALLLVTTNNNNGTVTGGGSYAAGTPVTLTATPNSGWIFAGWTPATCQNNFTMPSTAVTCMANFSLNPATTTTPSGLVLTVNTNGNGKVTGGGSYASGAAVALTATPDAGWSFTGWTPATCQNKFTMPTSNLTCTANFSLNPVANTDKSINIAFKGIQPRYKVGDKIKIDFDMNIKMASRFERVDLWIAVQFPDRHFLFFDQFGNPVVDPKLFKADINQLTSTQTLIDFEVPPNMEGTYTFYAVCVNKGKNPLPEPSGDGESVRCSDVIMGTTTLDK